MAKNLIQKFIESGIEFTEVQRAQAEQAIKELVRQGDLRRTEARRAVQSLVDKGREAVDLGVDASNQVVEVVQREVAKQLSWIAERVDDVEDQMESLVDKLTERGDDEAPAPTAAKKTPAKKSPAKKTAAKKSPAKKTTAKKTAAKKSAAKKSAARKKSATN